MNVMVAKMVFQGTIESFRSPPTGTPPPDMGEIMTRTAQPTAPVDNDTPVTVPTVETLVAAYNTAEGAAKATLRRDAQAAMGNAVRNGNFDLAKVYADAVDGMVSVTADKAPVDYAALVRARVATLLRAAQWLVVDPSSAEGTPDDFDTKVFANDVDLHAMNKAVEAIMGTFDNDTRDKILHDAHGLATRKINSGTKAAKRVVRDHIAEALTDTDGNLIKGFYTVTKIAKTTSNTYGDDLPSSGAVAAHFASKGWTDAPIPNVTFVKKGSRVSGMTTDAPADGVFVA